VLYELDDTRLATPRPLSPQDAYETAKEHFDTGLQSSIEFYETSRFALERGWKKKAAFLLHQCAEPRYWTHGGDGWIRH
jgi:hypothetical protein